MKKYFICVLSISFVSLQAFSSEKPDIRPDACLRMVKGFQKEYKCSDYSKLGSKNNICFYKNGIWNYGSYDVKTKVYTTSAVCDAGIKTRIVPSASDLLSKGSSILGLLKGETLVPVSVNELFRDTFGISVNVGDASSYKTKADIANWSKRRALAVFEGLTGVSSSSFPLNRKDNTPEQNLVIDDLLKTEPKNFANCVVVDGLGVTKGVAPCLAPKLSYDKKHNLVVTYPAGTCYPFYREVSKVKTNWWVRKTSDSYSVCTGGLQVKAILEGEEVTE